MQRSPRTGLVALLCLLALAGCGTAATPYAPATETGGYGITETQIDERNWLVTFAGNRFTSREQVENSVLYRAAEIAKMEGADGFVVLREEIVRDEHFPGPYYGPYGYPYGGFTHFGFYNFHGPTRYGHLLRPMRPYYGRPREEFTVSARIRLYSGSPPSDTGTMAYDADEVLTNLRPTIAPVPENG